MKRSDDAIMFLLSEPDAPEIDKGEAVSNLFESELDIAIIRVKFVLARLRAERELRRIRRAVEH